MLVVLYEEEGRTLRRSGEPHETCPTSGRYRLVPTERGEELLCDGCGDWGPRILILKGAP